nr:MAG TPA: hypothetical protein [Caudoviricetes sp.]
MKLKPRKTVFITRKLASFWFLSLLKLTPLLPFFLLHLLLRLHSLLHLLQLLEQKNRAANPKNRKHLKVALKVEEAKNCRSHLHRQHRSSRRVLVKNLLRKKIQNLFIL